MTTIAQQRRQLIADRRERTCNRQTVLLSRKADSLGLNTDGLHWTPIQGKLQPTFRKNYSPSGSAMS